MIFKVTGTYSDGLQVFDLKENLLYYSKTKTNWFGSSLVSIFNSDNKLLLEVKETGLFHHKHKINRSDGTKLNTRFSIKNGLTTSKLIYNESEEEILLKFSSMPLKNPYAKFLINSELIGQVLLRNKLGHRAFDIELKDDYHTKYEDVLFLFLCVESISNSDS